ncbi:MAG: hypothetical protein H0U37_02170, partial [Chloroflexi bacterium]|nr:hypothetical protein [Chloroflexota bacterium]
MRSPQRLTKTPGRTFDPRLLGSIRDMCGFDPRPSFAAIRKALKSDPRFATLPDSQIPSENTIRDICRAAPRGERWSLLDATPNEARYVLPVIAAVIGTTHGRLLAKMKLGGLSPTSQSHVRAVIRLVLGQAVRDGLVSRNAASREFVTMKTPQPRRVRAMSDDEMRAILAAVDGDRLTPLYRFIAATGCRLGEALGLRWRDVRATEVEFTQTAGRFAGADVFQRPKNEASRGTFPMIAPIRAALDA